jgi:hypothetical protein
MVFYRLVEKRRYFYCCTVLQRMLSKSLSRHIFWILYVQLFTSFISLILCWLKYMAVSCLNPCLTSQIILLCPDHTHTARKIPLMYSFSGNICFEISVFFLCSACVTSQNILLCPVNTIIYGCVLFIP